MQKILFLICGVLLGSCLLSSAENSELRNFNRDLEKFYNQYTQEGKVDYYRIRKEPDLLNKLTASVAIAAPEEEDLPAFLINAYNLLVIESVVKDVPLRSPHLIPGFFTEKKHTVMGEELSLVDLQKALLQVTSDPRTVFTLSNATTGSFKLLHDPYTKNNLEERLKRLADEYVNNNRYVRILTNNDKIVLTEDFIRPMKYIDKQNFIDMLNSYTEDSQESASETYPIEYFPVDRSLNILRI